MNHTMPDMSMLWNWRTRHFHVLFPWWHVQTPLDFVLTLAVVFSTAMLWEYMQAARYRLDVLRVRHARVEQEENGEEEQGFLGATASGEGALVTPESNPSEPLPGGAPARPTAPCAWKPPLAYVLSHTLSILMMLVYMTFNGYIILANIVGAGIGYCLFRRNTFMVPGDMHCCE